MHEYGSVLLCQYASSHYPNEGEAKLEGSYLRTLLPYVKS